MDKFEESGHIDDMDHFIKWCNMFSELFKVFLLLFVVQYSNAVICFFGTYLLKFIPHYCIVLVLL